MTRKHASFYPVPIGSDSLINRRHVSTRPWSRETRRNRQVRRYPHVHYWCMHEQSLLAQLVLTYALALALFLVLARVRFPPIVSFIFAGAIAGPADVGLVRREVDVNQLADLNIVLL